MQRNVIVYNQTKMKGLKKMSTLKMIYNNLQNGKVYGRMFDNCRYPFFDSVLYKTNTGFIGWKNYGSSANKNTLKELKWIIEVIFHCTPEEFVALYECR